MKRLKAALAAGALVIASAGTAAVLSAGSASAEMSGWERIEQSGDIPDGSSITTITAFCTSGKKAMGGGYDVGNQPLLDDIGVVIGANKATGSGSGWTVNFDQTSVDYGATVSVVCATP